MKKRDQPHDRYFKDLLEDIDIAKEFLLTYLDQAISKQIDWPTLAPYDVSLIGADNKQRYADVVYRAQTKKPSKTAVFFVLNHQRKADKLLPIRSLEYVLGTLKKTIKQGLVKPGFIVHMTWYNGQGKPYPYARSIFDYFADKELAKQLLYSAHQIITPAEVSDEELARHEKMAILGLFMKYGDDAQLLKWLEAHPQVASKLAEHKYIERSLEYVAEVGCHKLEDLLATFEKVSSKLKKTMLTTAQQLRQEGMQLGIEQGIEKTAKNMLFQLGLDLDTVQKATGLARAALEALQAAGK